MRPRVRFHARRRLILPGLLVLIAVLAIPVSSGIARSGKTKRVAKLQRLGDGGSVLANRRGRTLYSLSVEKHGRFICVAKCLSTWHPLTVPRRVRPKGPVRLGRVKRPGGKIQVTYRGRPLYVFAGDSRKGEINGEGIKDVGTWHAAKRRASSTQQPTQPGPYPTSPSSPTAPGPAPGNSPSQSPPSGSPPPSESPPPSGSPPPPESPPPSESPCPTYPYCY
jgi:predicted lipoprotein with Yx(FWY)xxD motif